MMVTGWQRPSCWSHDGYWLTEAFLLKTWWLLTDRGFLTEDMMVTDWQRLSYWRHDGYWLTEAFLLKTWWLLTDRGLPAEDMMVTDWQRSSCWRHDGYWLSESFPLKTWWLLTDRAFLLKTWWLLTNRGLLAEDTMVTDWQRPSYWKHDGHWLTDALQLNVVAVISDWQGPHSWRCSPRLLCDRHLPAEVTDRRVGGGNGDFGHNHHVDLGALPTSPWHTREVLPGRRPRHRHPASAYHGGQWCVTSVCGTVCHCQPTMEVSAVSLWSVVQCVIVSVHHGGQWYSVSLCQQTMEVSGTVRHCVSKPWRSVVQCHCVSPLWRSVVQCVIVLAHYGGQWYSVSLCQPTMEVSGTVCHCVGPP